MKKTSASIDLSQFPSRFHRLFNSTPVFDSSCSANARVWYIPGENVYLKRGAKDALATEAAMARFYHSKGFGPEVLEYLSLDQDWLLTQAVPGLDCTEKKYLDHPKALSQLLGQLLRMLHDTDPTGCPVKNRTAAYIETAERNYQTGQYDTSLFPDNWGYRNAEEAWATIKRFRADLAADTLIHGDYCLPNILLDDWKLSGFIDVGQGGIGDRHIDLFWGIWSLRFNLKTEAYTDRFLDAYGREKINKACLSAIGAFEVFG